jgi:hypothetical protein
LINCPKFGKEFLNIVNAFPDFAAYLRGWAGLGSEQSAQPPLGVFASLLTLLDAVVTCVIKNVTPIAIRQLQDSIEKA